MPGPYGYNGEGVARFSDISIEPLAVGTPNLSASLGATPITATGSTTARSLAARAADVANVLDFGGTSADISAAVVAAFTAKGTACEIYVPPGNWGWTSAVVLNLNNSTGFRFICDGTITPTAGIGSALTVENGQNPKIDISFLNGGANTSTEYGLHILNLHYFDISVSANNYGGYALFVDGTANANTACQAGVVRKLHVNGGYAPLLHGPASDTVYTNAFGKYETIWYSTTNPIIFQNCNDVTVSHIENFSPNGSVNALVLTNPTTMNFGNLLVGGATSGPLVSVTNPAAINIKKLYVTGNAAAGLSATQTNGVTGTMYVGDVAADSIAGDGINIGSNIHFAIGNYSAASSVGTPLVVNGTTQSITTPCGYSVGNIYGTGTLSINGAAINTAGIAFSVAGASYSKGIDLTGGSFSTGVALSLPNNNAIEWVAGSGAGAPQVPIISVSAGSVTYIRCPTSSGEVQIQDVNGNPVALFGATFTALNGTLQIGSAYTAATITPTGYIEITDSGGTVRKVPCA